ncbi:MAG: ribonuclease HIII [Candidatus Zixiibacteriota bacterium]|nr:MAG: ribonuclease HIII [candidate division Zixibacteria bacterium]
MRSRYRSLSKRETKSRLIPGRANISSGPINIQSHSRILGIDESGKGDFFGPLVIAGVLTDNAAARRLKDHGVRDSKKISDNRILELDRLISANFIHSIVIIGPEKYNQLYSRIRNLNKLLAWGHSRVIENIAENNAIDLAVSDKFGRTDFIENALMKKGKSIELRQEVRAEAVIQVAAASILARAGFIRYMNKLSKLYDTELPKGAGSIVDKAAAAIAQKYGREALDKIAKLHFKNYKKVLG